MSLGELRHDDDIMRFLGEATERLETARLVVEECKDFPTILEAQGEIKNLKWLLEQFED